MEDSQIVEAFLSNRDPELFELLVERYKTRVFRLVVSILGPDFSAEAEEVTQEVFLIVFQQISTFRRESRFGTWLYRIAYNRAIDTKRRSRFRHPHVSEEVLAAIPARPESSNPLARSVENQQGRLIRSFIDELPDLYRSVVYLHYWMDREIDEIAEYLAVPSGTVKSYLHRARQRLHHRMKSRELL